jgi:hypothetical protein
VNIFRIELVPLSVGVFGLLSLSAHAAPRDDVMSRALRCAVISESRSWLDCYYGAAQPARDALGLQPASPSQLTLVRSPQTASGPPQDVNVRGQVLSNAFRCTGPIDDHQWLNCYYAAAQPMRAVLGLPPAPQTGIKISGDEFGLAARHKPDIDTRTDHIESRMTNYTFDKLGIFTVALANGQVWRQVPGDTSYAYWKKPAASYTARISHGFLGSYNLEVPNNPGMFKVRRVQ